MPGRRGVLDIGENGCGGIHTQGNQFRVVEYDQLCGLRHVDKVGEIFGFRRIGSRQSGAETQARCLVRIERTRLMNGQREPLQGLFGQMDGHE